MNFLQYYSRRLAIFHIYSLLLFNKELARLVDAVHGNLHTVNLGGNGELEEWGFHHPRPGASCSNSMMYLGVKPVEWSRDRLATPSEFQGTHSSSLSATLVQRPYCPLPKYIVVPLNGQPLALSHPNFTILYILKVITIDLQVGVHEGFGTIGFKKIKFLQVFCPLLKGRLVFHSSYTLGFYDVCIFHLIIVLNRFEYFWTVQL